MSRRRRRPAPAAAAHVLRGELRDRIVRVEKIRGRDLLADPRNFREHTDEQRAVVAGMIRTLGVIGGLLARDTPAGPVLLDGHLRDAPDFLWTVLVTDLSEDESALALALLDKSAALAEENPAKLAALLDRHDVDDPQLQTFIEQERAEADAMTLLAGELAGDDDAEDEDAEDDDGGGAARPSVVLVAVAVPDLAVVERALGATGMPRRGDALVALARSYLQAHGTVGADDELPELPA